MTLAPPLPAPPRAAPVERRDAGAEWLATLFARRYLSWSAADPQGHARGLAAIMAPGAEPDGGLRPGPGTSQRVLLAQILAERHGGSGERVYSVAVETNRGSAVYLSVAVGRDAEGHLALTRLPSLVGAPWLGRATLAASSRPSVSDRPLAAVVERALANYLAGSRENLAADLAPRARVSVPPSPLTLGRVDDLRLQRDGAVAATVLARDAAGTEFTLAYELDVVRTAGRWEISAIQTDPSA